MPDSFSDLKRKSLENRLAALHEEFEAANAQLNHALSGVDRVRIQRQIKSLEEDITKTESELGEIKGDSVKPDEPESPEAQTRTLLKLQLLQRQPNKIEIRGIGVPGGGLPKAQVDLPYSLDELPAILKALDVGEYIEARFKSEYKQALERLGLLNNNRLHPNFHAIVGQKLYHALFTGEILTEFAIAERASQPIACQLGFDPQDVILAQFPWELIHDGSLHRVPIRGGVELTRYVTLADPPEPLETQLPLRILFISPRPRDDDPLRVQASALLDGLESLREGGQLTWKQLDPPTWEALEECLYDETFDIIHFDGHGSFARVCPACTKAHYPSSQTCVRCSADMSDSAPQGYLHFEDGGQGLDRVSVEDMKLVLANSQTHLVFLSACGTGVVKGVSVFNGIAPGLIQIGIPAVVAMQGSPPDASSMRFVERFYGSLAKGKRVPEAVNGGRRAIFRSRPLAWFMPVVYLRSSDDTYGRLFNLSE